ncbi:MAG: hypothetical protein CV082_02660 [Candidatus Brocadia sp. BL1]|nr:MAG: hypothetical protein CV082_02660 [Candidatus Brocadia sp. BL1]
MEQMRRNTIFIWEKEQTTVIVPAHDVTYPRGSPCLMNLFTLRAIAANSTCNRALFSVQCLIF